jgi:hypothetical protein
MEKKNRLLDPYGIYYPIRPGDGFFTTLTLYYEPAPMKILYYL